MTTQPYNYQPALDFINSHGLNATTHDKPYKLLFKLCKIHGYDINGAQSHIVKAYGFSQNEMNKMARESVELFCVNGRLVFPAPLLFRRKDQKKPGYIKPDKKLRRAERQRIIMCDKIIAPKS